MLTGFYSPAAKIAAKERSALPYGVGFEIMQKTDFC